MLFLCDTPPVSGPDFPFDQSSTLFLAHVPFLLYFLVSLSEIPLDLAILRFITCYVFPVFLWWTFAHSTLLGIGLCAVLWVTLTRPTPFSVIRLPYGRLRSRVRQVVRSHSRESGGEKKVEGNQVFIEDDAVNPFAAFAFVELVTPLILSINKLEIVFGPKKKVPRILPTSEINWLFSKINEVGRGLDQVTGRTILWNDYSGIGSNIRKFSGSDHIEFEDHTLEGLKLFWKDISYGKNSRKVSAVGRLLIKNFMVGILVAKESAVRFMNKNPWVLQENKIEKPVFIVGLPRTGSTFLQGLLAQDPDVRHIRMWETNIPTPPPREETYNTDPRCEMINRGLNSAKIVDWSYMEETRKHHYVCGEAAEEDLMLLHHSFLFLSHYFLTGDGEFKEWFYSQHNKQYAYRYIRRFLQVISAHYRPRSHFVLKAPIHTLYLDSLLREFPDARVIVTHRDPVGIIISWAQFQAQMLNIYTELDHDNSIPYVKETFYMLSEMCKRLIAVRKEHPNPSQFFDVHFDAITKDPIGTVKKIYAHFGLTFTEAYHERLKTFLSQDPKEGKSNAKKVPFEDAGLTRQEVQDAFADYIQEYLTKPN